MGFTSGDVVFVSRDDKRKDTPASLLVQLPFPYHILCDHLAAGPRIKSVPESTTKRWQELGLYTYMCD